MTLSTTQQTRMAVKALRDLQEFQQNLQAMASGLFVLDNCGLQVEFKDL